VAIRIGINGFGRIGRNTLRAAKKLGMDLDFVAVNDLTDTKTLAHLLRYDSVHGRFPGEVKAEKDALLVDGDSMRVLTEKDPAKLLRNLQGVRVNVIGLTDENREDTKNRIEAVRSQLSNSGWDRIVTVKDGSEDVGVFVKLRGEEAIEGVVVTIVNGDREAVFVNVVGNIQPEQIAKVGESLNIKPLKEIGRQIESHN
jgi:glyceraldehyde-3-phosphate dehydrogenase/erythrose-4-phosphate dehydrogenase